jgi:hypothetical protein
MKKIGIILVMIVATLSFTNSANAQWKTFGTVAGDTVIAASARDTVNKVIPLTAGYSSVAIKVEYTKISGTVSLKAYIYPGDGTDYEVASDSSAAFSDASGVVYFTKTSTPYSHYKVQIRPATGAATTQSAKIVVKYLPKRYDD